MSLNWITTGLVNVTGLGEALRDNATDGAGDTDELIGIENVIGSQFHDKIQGSGEDNELEGEGGNDLIEGGAGRTSCWGGVVMTH